MTKFMLILKCFLLGLFLATLFFMFAIRVNETFAGVSFYLLWPGCAYGLWHLSRRGKFMPPSSFTPTTANRSRRFHRKRLVVTGVLAVVFAVVLAFATSSDLVLGMSIPFWIALYYGWPYLSRRVPSLDLDKTPASVPVRPVWLRLIRGSLATVGAVLFVFICMISLVVVPITLCERRAQKVASSIHVGMTVQQVLDTAKECDVFHAGSEAPYDKGAAGDNIPAMGLAWRRDGSYVTYDLASRQNLVLSENEAIQRLHTKLRDGYKWYFSYTYVNVTPMHVSFSVIFGPDGRVSEVTPVHGWD